jgi:hypothetical protein
LLYARRHQLPTQLQAVRERDVTTWDVDWALALLLIVRNVVIHVLGLGVINERIVARVSNRVNPLHLTALSVVVMAAATLIVTVLHAIEGTVWAVAYRVPGAVPDNGSAMLHSLSAMTHLRPRADIS